MSFKTGMPLMFHAADLHIGDSRNLPNYLGRQQQMLTECTRVCIEREVDLAVYCGDIFDSKYMLPKEKDLFTEWLIDNDRTAKRADFWVVLENGNHDEVEEGYTHLRMHKLLAERNMLKRTIVIEDQPQLVGPFKDQIWCAVVPAKNYKGEELNFIVGALYKKWAADCEKAGFDLENGYFVVMAHEGVYGAVNELGTYRAKRGPKLDPELPVTYWALGDIHTPFQQILPNAWYPGSPIQHDFGDLSTKRGVLVVDLDNPEEPEPVLFEGITPLITLSQIPDEWPEDAIIRFEGTADELVDTAFPDNVVGFRPVIDDQEIAAAVDVDGEDLMMDLPAVLVDQDVPQSYRDEVTEEIESAAASL